ncbi:hypothetical protein OKA04_04605 [Luteolibacter flavescens]|uniref:Uncharacterized protein n=1 Tax=Luteolibacter flavescens TaxID=1859460 RepID=A0ABT3FK99_9BACT|nr:hypothetical protein [Luteolibacter flavescens]MCW1883997.1 hypothetical protein [Luteolibacter flavescens]
MKQTTRIYKLSGLFFLAVFFLISRGKKNDGAGDWSGGSAVQARPRTGHLGPETVANFEEGSLGLEVLKERRAKLVAEPNNDPAREQSIADLDVAITALEADLARWHAEIDAALPGKDDP